MSGTDEKNSSVNKTEKIEENGYELIADPKDQVEVIGSDYEDADWDDCEAPLKKKNEVKDTRPASSPTAASTQADKKPVEKGSRKDKVRKQMVAALEHLKPEIKGEEYLEPPVEDFYKD
ncbi:hypothetical protein FLONG3_6414 [Fusarium longipes]|uniref:Uncharacterized protein n=1 Tax=Fusarium longipes TaxID=694270 RepID=A0A395SLW9_9HYPO|nr:hypothetical protein FLONG3_6414 [Fusarium longipes]